MLYCMVTLGLAILGEEEQVLPAPNLRHIVCSIPSLSQAIPLLYVLYMEILYENSFEKGSCYPKKQTNKQKLRKAVILMNVWGQASLLAQSTSSSPASSRLAAGRTEDLQPKPTLVYN